VIGPLRKECVPASSLAILGEGDSGIKLTGLNSPSFTVKKFSFHAMSQHKSLQGASGIVRKRNVLKRFERVEILKKRGQWKEGDRVQGLRKTKPGV